MEYYEIIHYGTGMTPKTLRIDDEAEARTKWAAMKADPYAGASSFQKVTLLDVVR